jgi:hypothetical protein
MWVKQSSCMSWAKPTVRIGFLVDSHDHSVIDLALLGDVMYFMRSEGRSSS